jgi:hypothetical protein
MFTTKNRLEKHKTENKCKSKESKHTAGETRFGVKKNKKELEIITSFI